MDGLRRADLAHYSRRLAAALPGLDLSDLRLVESGQNSDVLFIGDDLIARFPRYPAGIRKTEWEANLLRALGRRLPAAIPDPVVVHDGEPGEAFMVYRAVPGVSLARNTLAGIEDEQSVDAIASDLALVLRTLHGIPPEEIPLPAAVSGHWLDRWKNLYERIRRVLFPLMSGAACTWTERHFETFLGDLGNRAVVPRLVHGDFGAANILIDPDERRVTGVIDFASAHLDDPAVDLAAASTLGPGFLHRFAPAYPNLNSALPRVSFYKGTFALQEALFGAENDDPGALAAGLADVPPPPETLEV